MPHFVVDCSLSLLELHDQKRINKCVHDTARSTGLFDVGDIKVRVQPFAIYTVGGTQEEFVHVFAHIMEGRSVAQRADLARRVVGELASMFPRVPNIAMNVAEFEKATYCNRQML